MLDMGAAVTVISLDLPTCVQPVTRAVCLVLAMHQGACRCFSGRRSGGGSVAVHEPVVSVSYTHLTLPTIYSV